LHQIRQSGLEVATLWHFLIWLFIAGHLKMAVKLRGGVMSIDGSTNNVTAFETDMRDVLQTRNTRLPNVTRQPDNDYSALVSGISVQSIQEIDRLIAGLQGLREKLNNDGDRLHQAIAQHSALSQSVIELTKIVSDGMTSVNKSSGV
jgi:hypothetical protein